MTEKETQSLKALRALRHSAAHTLAQAVKKLYPSAQVGVGPATEDGFYYDFRYVRSNFSGKLKSTWIVDNCQALPIASWNLISILGP